MKTLLKLLWFLGDTFLGTTGRGILPSLCGEMVNLTLSQRHEVSSQARPKGKKLKVSTKKAQYSSFFMF